MQKSRLFYIMMSLPIVMTLILSSCKQRQKITSRELQDHIRYLSSESLEGRLTGSSGDSLAAEYIRNDLASFGYIPLSGDGFQRFRVTSRLVAGKENALSFDGQNFIPEKDFVPLSFSSDSELESEVVFIGYGFNINTDSLKWNDYKNIDVNGKWVLLLRADPETDKTASLFIPYSDDRDKALLAKDMGASGVLLVSGQEADPQDTFESLDSGDFPVGIPAIRIRREVADILLSGNDRKITELENLLNTTRKPFSFSTGKSVYGKADIAREMSTTRNVVMILPGEDEQLKNEYIIIGAHFDHLGMGGKGSSSRNPDTVAVHHGADDNASGVGMMLELAEKFALSKEIHKRSIICIAFSGEELGLLGSKYFTENPGIDLSKVNVMINLDMVGRLGETNTLQVSGVGTAAELRDLFISATDTNLIKLTLSEEGYGPSDHSSFYGKNIPVLFYSTGAHLDYHTPADSYDKINYEGMVKISTPLFNVAELLSNKDSMLKFIESGPPVTQERRVRRKGVTLGIMPDFAGNVKNGLRADFVTPGRPAALGGMMKGDIITSINGMTVNNIQDYMFRMGQMKHGQTINVEILRSDKKMILLIQL